MAGSKRTHNGKRPPSPIPEYVPNHVPFVNHTILTNQLVRKGCAITVSSVVRICYLAVGIAVGVAALLFRIFAESPTIVTVVVLLLGLMLVIQGMRLPNESARGIVSRLNKSDASARDRYYWADDEHITVSVAGKTHSVAWKEVKLAIATADVTCLVLNANSVLFILDNHEFLRGSAAGFQELAAKHVEASERNAFAKWCDKTMFTLDNWRALHPHKRRR